MTADTAEHRIAPSKAFSDSFTTITDKGRENSGLCCFCLCMACISRWRCSLATSAGSSRFSTLDEPLRSLCANGFYSGLNSPDTARLPRRDAKSHAQLAIVRSPTSQSDVVRSMLSSAVRANSEPAGNGQPTGLGSALAFVYLPERIVI